MTKLTTRNRVRRLSAATALALAVAGLHTGSAPAQAAPPPAVGEAVASVDVSDSVCSVSPSAPVRDDKPIVWNGRAVSTRVNSSYTVTSASDPADVTTIGGRTVATTRGKVSGKQFRSLTIRGSGRLTVDRPSGSDCEPDATLNNVAFGEFAIRHPGWLRARAQASRQMAAAAIVGGQGAATSLLAVGEGNIFSKPYTGSSRIEVKPGPHFAEIGLIWTHDALTGGFSRSAPGDRTGSVTLSYVRAGSAKSQVKGGGKKYVKPTGQRNCGSGKLSLSMTKKAKQAEKIQVFAGKKKVKTIGKPKRGSTSIKLKKSVRTVKAVVQLKGGGKATVKRSYEVCL